MSAFRTGKRFLLSLFLRYLEAHCVRSSTTGTSGSSSMGYGEVLSDITNNEDSKKWFERVQTLNQHEESFD
jgi:hypothetical protein